MISDTVIIRSGGEGIKEALDQAEAVARFKLLSEKQTLHLRLLTEETAGMLRAVAGDVEAAFRIEERDGCFELHLKAETMMTGEKRKQLIALTSGGRNEAAKGFMGKIRQLFETVFEPVDENTPSTFSAGWLGASSAVPTTELGDIPAEIWSLNSYKDALKDREDRKEAWDELEKSVVSRLADEVRVTIGKGQVELVIEYKVRGKSEE